LSLLHVPKAGKAVTGSETQTKEYGIMSKVHLGQGQRYEDSTSAKLKQFFMYKFIDADKDLNSH
jgi:hypothetical protein